MGICNGCLTKQLEIDRLQEQVASLKGQLRYRTKQQQEGFFGSSTPSAKIPVKANVPKVPEAKKKGAKKGHVGHGRPSFEEDENVPVDDIPLDVHQCPECGGHELEECTGENRSVLEAAPVRAERRVQRLHAMRCKGCGHRMVAKAKGVLPRNLLGNQLLSNAITMHYGHGAPIHRVAEQLGVQPGTLVQGFQRVAGFLGNLPDRLVLEYRQAPAKHADETTWRTQGKNGYAWLFATTMLSIFLFRNTRASSVPLAVFGAQRVPGVTVVDRYAGYNKVPCEIQYCLAHLLREVQDLEKGSPDNREIKRFVEALAPLLAEAIGLRAQPISDEEFYRQASKLEQRIRETNEAPAQHAGIRRIQDIFRDSEARLYHWAKDRRVPADNNRAERDLRPTVVARKVSFGSQSDLGCETRSVLMTTLHTMAKRGIDANATLKHALDILAVDPKADPYPLLFGQPPPEASTLDPLAQAHSRH